MAKVINQNLSELVKITYDFDAVNFTLLVENLNKVNNSSVYYNPLFELKTLSLVYGVSVTKDDLLNQIYLFEENEFKTKQLGITSYFENQLYKLNDGMIQKLLVYIYNDGNLAIKNKEDYIEMCNLAFSGYGKSQFESYTPDTINKLMGKLIDLEDGESIYDCASGTATSLLAITNNSNKLFSQEINSTEIIRQELLFKLFDYEKVEISNKSSLNEPMIREKTVDKVICNPPFMLKTFEQVDDMLTTIDGKDFSSSKDANVYFYNLMTKVAKEKAVFVAPTGLLFKSSNISYEYKNWILKSNFVEAIIQLPVGAYLPYSGVSTAIIVINKKKNDNKIMMIDLTNSSYVTKERRSVTINEEDMDKIIDIIINREAVKGFSNCITINDMDSKTWNMTPNKYIEFEENEVEEIDLQQLINCRNDLLSELKKQSDKVDVLINKLKGDD